MTPTAERQRRADKDWTDKAKGEPCTVEPMPEQGCTYIFTTELGALRLEHAGKGRAEYSPSFETWYLIIQHR